MDGTCFFLSPYGDQSLAGLIEDHRTCMLSQTYLLSKVSLCTVTLFVTY
jgi:hypothetical protein